MSNKLDSFFRKHIHAYIHNSFFYRFLENRFFIAFVTNEKLGDNKTKDYKIPNVCQALNIPYMNLHTFLDQILE
ncbi:MAG: DUF4411 family protein [Tyzzerella sp.]|nr:DUF4411 family protein [Tyzzerella sp.]